MNDSALRPDDDDPGNYVLDGESVWIRVKNISVYLRKGDVGVSVAFYPVGHESTEPLATSWSPYDPAWFE